MKKRGCSSPLNLPSPFSPSPPFPLLLYSLRICGNSGMQQPPLQRGAGRLHFPVPIRALQPGLRGALSPAPSWLLRPCPSFGARFPPRLLPTEHTLRQVRGNMSPRAARAPSPAEGPSDSLFILVECFTQIIISKVNIVKIQIICSRNERITVGAHQSGGSAPQAGGFLLSYWEPRC